MGLLLSIVKLVMYVSLEKLYYENMREDYAKVWFYKNNTSSNIVYCNVFLTK